MSASLETGRANATIIPPQLGRARGRNRSPQGAAISRSPDARHDAARDARQAMAVSESEPSHKAFRRDIEGLRAVAILLVVLYHVHIPVIRGGYVGVDVFFVISGFLITSQLVAELTQKRRISFSGFYARRARRILPAATLATIVTVVASAVVLNPLEAQRVQKDAMSAVFFGANYHFAAADADYFNADLPPSPMQHYWSLSVEEQFYILWPLLLMVASGARRRSRDGRHARPVTPMVVAILAPVALASLLASMWQTSRSPSWAYYSITTRAWELAVGALLAIGLPLTRRLDRRLAIALAWTGLACIALAAAEFTSSTPFPGSAALVPVLGAAAVIAGGGVRRRWAAETVLGTPPLQSIGRWSYSWYLWHWPVLILGVALLGRPPAVAGRLGLAAVSLAIAGLSFTLVEQPIRRLPVIVRRPRLGLACGGALAACALGVVAMSGALVGPLGSTAIAAPPALGAKHRLTRAQLAADLARGLRTAKVPANVDPPLRKAADAKPVIVTNGCHLQHPGSRSRPCVYGDRTSSTSVVLFGDSHAATWFPALDRIARRHHWRLVDLTKAGCPAAEVSIRYKEGPYPQCTAWRRNAQAQIAALHPLLVIAAWARYIEVPEAEPLAGVPAVAGSTWQNGVAAIFRFLHGAAQHTLFISDTPTIARSVPDCVAAHISNVRACTTGRGAATLLPAVKSRELRIAAQEHVATIDPTSWFCTRRGCPVIVGNILLYRDRAHMTPAWSRFIAPVLADAILPVVQR
jgi:peptidoglycan/LPS O-acetylase OafA/YrhL